MGLPANKLESTLIRTLDNKFVPEDDPTVYYFGEFDLLVYRKNFDIIGRATLEKYKRRKIFDKLVWDIQTQTDLCYVTFVKNGKVMNGYENKEDYRVALRERACSSNINLSHTLFENVFGPIDTRLMEIYRQAVAARDS